MIEQLAQYPSVRVVRHPLIHSKLTLCRRRQATNREFRTLVSEIAALMVYELTSDYPTRTLAVETPLGPATGVELAREITLVPILRAGLGMTEGVMQLIPQARIGHIGLFRDESTLQPVTYYNKLPRHLADSDVIVIDPMLATGGSLSAAVTAVKAAGAQHIRILCLVSAPEGIRRMAHEHPDVITYTAAVDDHLTAHGYIVPGLGDAGDRLFGTE